MNNSFGRASPSFKNAAIGNILHQDFRTITNFGESIVLSAKTVDNQTEVKSSGQLRGPS
jgi:hypothetical protein